MTSAKEFTFQELTVQTLQCPEGSACPIDIVILHTNDGEFHAGFGRN